MKLTRVLTQIAVLASALAGGSAYALDIATFSGTIAGHGASSQMGRLSRNGIQQDYYGVEPFPGVINPTVQYFYTTYSFNAGNTPYIQIDVDSTSANTFFSAYLTSYLPNSSATGNFGFDTHWLGDLGNSGDAFGVDPAFFNILVPGNSFITIVASTTSATLGVGINDPFSILVEGFIDSSFDDPPEGRRVPEPSTLLLGLAPLAMLAATRRGTRRRASRPA